MKKGGFIHEYLNIFHLQVGLTGIAQAGGTPVYRRVHAMQGRAAIPGACVKGV
jgi:hypothetical protein